MKSVLENNVQWINEIWNKIDTKMQRVTVASKNKLPYTTTNGVHDDKAISNPNWWTNGFWPGIMWLMYCDTKNELYKETAEMPKCYSTRLLKIMSYLIMMLDLCGIFQQGF